MSDRHRTPRRPAMLDAEDAEYIIGDEDPAEGAAVAHTAAWAVMGVGDAELGPEAVEKLRAAIRSEGTDIVAGLWARSPEFTLPGALWRLYLLSEWYRRDRDQVVRRYEEGRLARVIPGLEHPVAVPDLTATTSEVDALLQGHRTDDDLAGIIGQAARLLRVLAAGETYGATWIDDRGDPLAHPVTTRAQALLRTADELDEAARHAEVGTLN